HLVNTAASLLRLRCLPNRRFVPYKSTKSHFVRISFALVAKFAGNRLTHHPLKRFGDSRNEKNSLRGRVRARDDRVVAEYSTGARDGGCRGTRLDQYCAHQERAQTDPGPGTSLGSGRGSIARSRTQTADAD